MKHGAKGLPRDSTEVWTGAASSLETALDRTWREERRRKVATLSWQERQTREKSFARARKQLSINSPIVSRSLLDIQHAAQ